MSERVCLITGGAGFIGCAISGVLADEFDRVVAVDNLHPQVHSRAERPSALDGRVEFIRADVTGYDAWNALLDEMHPTAVVHLAAETGTGQSLTEATRHASVNVVGTTQMLDAFCRNGRLPERIVLTSSRAVYGEGAWCAADGALVYPGQRSRAMLEAGEWDFPGLTPTPFDSRRVHPAPTSVYGATKLAQEHILTSWCLSMNVTPVVYRLQNVYGPGQSLSNPYTGIVPFFAQKAKAGEVLPVYEDGQIVRDFVYIDDVVAALLAGVRAAPGGATPYDIGSGEGTSILRLGELIAAHYGAPAPRINGMFRDGDVRHASCKLDESIATLDWRPQVMVAAGVPLLLDWIDTLDD
jgi:dTDP-L-rhamnose 4-epimerase